ncbi:MAG TPA: hypothetical protein EYO73_07315 [Sulfurimonas sp.]|nr:hypothetical protein [Sulfurimonas sp.]
MFTISIEKECTCFKRSKFKSTQSFDNEKDAFETATKMAKEMTRDFCKNHAFSVVKEENNFLILLMS